MKQLRVRDIMTTTLVTADVLDSVGTAVERMGANRVHHLPVAHNGRLVGLVTHHDLAAACLQYVSEMEAGEECSFQRVRELREVMRTEIITTTPEARAIDAANILKDRKVGCLPVVDGGLLVGIITRADFLAIAIDHLQSAAPARSARHERRL